jgi:hypothetical protein
VPEAQIAELKAALPPKPKPEFVLDQPRVPRDLTAGMTMPRQALEEMVNATQGVMRDIRNDRVPRSVPEPLEGGGGVRVVASQNGWVDPLPLTNSHLGFGRYTRKK